jgi:poly(hydroxyalkanoate) granule-associated protein
MVKKAEEVVQESQEEIERTPLVELAHKVLLASMGAVALAQEEVEEFVGRLVERGGIAEKEGRKLVLDVVEKRKTEAKKAEDEVDRRLEDLLSRMNVPTKNDIDALSAKITALSKKVDELKKA